MRDDEDDDNPKQPPPKIPKKLGNAAESLEEGSRWPIRGDEERDHRRHVV